MSTDYDKIDSRCNIEIRGVAFAEDEPAMLAAVLARAVRWTWCASSIVVQCDARVPADAPAHKSPGWLEYGMRVNYKNGGGITIGAIQRSVGADIEFHS